MPESKWEKANAMIQRDQRTALAPTEKQSTPLAPIDAQINEIQDQKLGLIAGYKANQIQRNAALEKLKALTNAQLESTQHALRRAVEIEKQRIDVIADKYIYQLTEEYLKDLRELGLTNFETRMKTLMQLNEIAARLIEAADAQDLPDAMKTETLDAILQKRKEFFNRIVEEEMRLPQ